MKSFLLSLAGFLIGSNIIQLGTDMSITAKNMVIVSGGVLIFAILNFIGEQLDKD